MLCFQLNHQTTTSRRAKLLCASEALCEGVSSEVRWAIIAMFLISIGFLYKSKRALTVQGSHADAWRSIAQKIAEKLEETTRPKPYVPATHFSLYPLSPA